METVEYIKKNKEGKSEKRKSLIKAKWKLKKMEKKEKKEKKENKMKKRRKKWKVIR